MATMMHSTARIPQELVDYVIDELSASTTYTPSERTATLSNCAVVCSAWQPRSSRHLLKQVYVRGGHDLPNLLSLAAVSQRLAKNVQTLCFRASWKWDVHQLLAAREDLSKVLPRYHFLRICEGRPAAPIPPEGAGSSVFPPARFDGHLELSSVPRQLVPDILHAFSHVDTLTIIDIRLKREELQAMQDKALDMTVNTLILDRITSVFTVEVIELFFRPLSVAVLSFYGDLMHTAHQFLPRGGEMVEHVSFRPNDQQNRDETWSFLTDVAVSCCPKLSSLDLDMLDFGYWDDAAVFDVVPFKGYISGMMSQLPSHMELIRIAFAHDKLCAVVSSLASPLHPPSRGVHDLEALELHIPWQTVPGEDRYAFLRAEADRVREKLPEVFAKALRVLCCDDTSPMYRGTHERCYPC